MFSLYYGHWDYWELRHKVTFDGINRQIIINDGVSVVDVKRDIYSDWKEWSRLRDNLKYIQAIRTIGGDAIDTLNNRYAGDIYFLMNGWKVVVKHAVQLTGILYSDDGSTPYVIEAGGGIQATVSNLAQTIISTVPVVTGNLSAVAAAVANVPAASAAAVRTALTPELNKINSQIDGLTPSQLTMLTEMYRLMGLDPTKPLVVTKTTVDAGAEIHQAITGDDNQTTVTRT